MSEVVVIAGASGFIGKHLAGAFLADGADVRVISRPGSKSFQPAGGRLNAQWGDADAIAAALDGAGLLVNLAGKSVNCRYSRRNREEILRSRVDTTRELSMAIATCANPPALWINSSTATIYRHAEDRPMTESTGEIGTGFSVGIARAWEHALFEAELPRTRRVALRMAIVLGDGSALIPLMRLARFGLGGPQLDGRWFRTQARLEAGTFHEFRARGGSQRFSWIHISDVLGIIRFLRAHPEISGPVNASAPNASDNVTLMRTLREVLHVPFGIPAPRFVLEIGTALIRSETELVLKSRWVEPERVLDAGYEFTQPILESALRDIIDARRLASQTAKG